MGSLNRAFIALGSNIEPEANLREAVRLLAAQCRLLTISPVYQTEPVGTTDQLAFLNAAALIETELDAAALKTRVLQEIEQALGRKRTADKNAPRTIDLDITMFNSEVFDLGPRHIPDPDLLRYAHVAVPMADLAPQFVHPETGQTLEEIAQGMAREGLKVQPDVRL